MVSHDLWARNQKIVFRGNWNPSSCNHLLISYLISKQVRLYKCNNAFKSILLMNILKFMHQSIPPVPSPHDHTTTPQPPPPTTPGLTPRHWHFFCLGWQIPRGGDFWAVKFPGVGTKKDGKWPRPPSTLQHFTLVAQSNSAVLSILMCDFLFQFNIFLCNSTRILLILMTWVELTDALQLRVTCLC